MAGIDERTARRRRHRRARVLIGADGRLAVEAALLRPFGGRHVLEYERAYVHAVEHLFCTYDADIDFRRNLDLLQAIASAVPHLRFADFWHGYLRYLAAEAMLGRQRQHL